MLRDDLCIVLILDRIGDATEYRGDEADDKCGIDQQDSNELVAESTAPTRALVHCHPDHDARGQGKRRERATGGSGGEKPQHGKDRRRSQT